MVNTNTIGRMKCPICGEEMQDVRVNKNGNLYMYCDNNCRVTFPPRVQRVIKPLLAEGKNASYGNLFITATTKGQTINAGQPARRTVTEQSSTRTIATTTARPPVAAGNATVRRTDSKPAAVGSAEQHKPASRIGKFAEWLAGDDDEE